MQSGYGVAPLLMAKRDPVALPPRCDDPLLTWAPGIVEDDCGSWCQAIPENVERWLASQLCLWREGWGSIHD
jgi:hypothetical protein